MIFIYFMALSFLLFSVGMVGVAATRHLIIMVLAVEIILSASILLSVSLFSYGAGGDIIGLLFSIWSVAASETICLIAIYRYMSKNEMTMDVTKLSRLRDR